MRRVILHTVIALSCVGCDYTVLSIEAGDHVVYHWDAADNRLCGGTIPTADRFVGLIPAYYGLPLSTTGPNVEYFWDIQGLLNTCGWAGGKSGGCAIQTLTGFTVFTNKPLDSHELAHTSRGGHGQPRFINEGFASRWQSELLGDTAWRTRSGFSSEAELRAQFTIAAGGEVDYALAHKWWIALELEYGPAKMGELSAAFDSAGSLEDVEVALEQVLGISLAESAELAASLPELILDDPACELSELPTLVWDGAPLVVEHNDARCEDNDMVNLAGSRVTWLFALEFPADWSDVTVGVMIPDSVDRRGKAFLLAGCDGEISLYDYTAAIHYVPGTETQQYMAGRYVAALRGPLNADGSVDFPVVTIQEHLP